MLRIYLWLRLRLNRRLKALLRNPIEPRVEFCAEETSYFELFFDDLLAHFIKLMEAYQAAERNKWF